MKQLNLDFPLSQMRMYWPNNEHLKNILQARRKKWKKFEHGRDYGRFKPNEEKVRKTCNGIRVSNTTIDKNNTIVNPDKFNIESEDKVNSITLKEVVTL